MMLRSLVAAALVAGTGCVTWQTTHAGDTSSFDDNRAFLVTADRAFDLDVSLVDAAGVRGTARHVWTVPAGKLNLDYLNDTTDSPEQIAANLGWPADHADDGKPISVDRATIQYVRERRVSGGRTVLAVVGGLALAALVGVVIVGFYLKMGLGAIWVVLCSDLLCRGVMMYMRFLHGGWKTVEV